MGLQYRELDFNPGQQIALLNLKTLQSNFHQNGPILSNLTILTRFEFFFKNNPLGVEKIVPPHFMIWGGVIIVGGIIEGIIGGGGIGPPKIYFYLQVKKWYFSAKNGMFSAKMALLGAKLVL